MTDRTYHLNGVDVTPNAETAFLLDKVEEANLPPSNTLSVEQVREQFKARSAPATFAPIDLPEVRDIILPLDQRELNARVYVPVKSDRPLPVIVYYHGGGFVIGDVESYDPVCRKISAESGAIVISVDYRLAPESKFPAQMHDALDSFEYLATRITEFGGDPDKIFACGDSAGGTLSTIIAQEYSLNDKPFKLKGQLLIYPAINFRDSTPSREVLYDVFPIPKWEIDWFTQQSFKSEADLDHVWSVLNLRENLITMVPTLVITAGLDPLVDEGQAYAKKIAEIQPDTVLRHFPGTVHGFIGMGRFIPDASQCVKEIASFVTKTCS